MMNQDRWTNVDSPRSTLRPTTSPWLRLTDDGDRAVVAFLGEPFAREVCVVGGTYVPCTAALRELGYRPKVRVAFNVAVLASPEVRVLEQGILFFDDFSRIRQKYDLTSWAFEVQRRGRAYDLNTSYSILPERTLSERERGDVATLAMYDLRALYARPRTPQVACSRGVEARRTPNGRGDLPADLRRVLRALSAQSILSLVARFGVERVRDLASVPVSELTTAAIEKLRQEAAGATAEGTETP